MRQIQEKKRTLYFAFVDLEKAFDRVPRKVLWWSLRKVGVEEWIVKVVQAMYDNARSRVRVNDSFSEPVGINVGVHQGSVLSPLLFLIVLEALSREFKTGCPWEMLYADDLVLVDEDLNKLIERLITWKQNLEMHGLRVNMGKTKGLVSGCGLETLKDKGKFPCGVCRSGTGRNSILCSGCNHWVHKLCSGITGRLKENPTFKCARFFGKARPIDGRPATEFAIGDQLIEVVDCFCYLGDSVGAGGGRSEAVTTRIRCAWGKFKALLPLLTSMSISWARKVHLYQTCVRKAMLHASECWAPTKANINRLNRSDQAILRWICKVKLSDRVATSALLKKLNLLEIENEMRANHLGWYGHVHRSSN